MDKLWDSLISWWLEYRGRNQLAKAYTFSNHEIVSPGTEYKVSFFFPRIYLNLHPALSALCVFPDGEVKVIKGGLNPYFPFGKYLIHFVDKTDRQSELLKIAEITNDAARISLALKIIFRISNPLKAFEIQKPVETFYSQIQADLKDYIRKRNYEDLIGGGDGEVIDSDLVAKFIKQQHAVRYPINQLFSIVDIIIQEKEGDPVFIEKRKNYKSQVVDSEAKMKVQDLNKKIASQEAEMEQLKYQYKAILEQQKATADVQQTTIRQQISIQELEIQKMRNAIQQTQDAWDQQQAKWLRSMDVIESAVKSPYFREVEGAVIAVVNEMRRSIEINEPVDPSGVSDVKGIPVESKPDNLDITTNRLLNLLDRRKPEEKR
ncbi:MAG: FlxA-like family protein [Anaerolineae bacterium]|nr:FlxA-like family protein [Anaerolineae bacterium]